MTQPLISQGQDVSAVLQLPCLELWLNWTLSVGSRCCTALEPLADHTFPCSRVKISWSEQHCFLCPGDSLQIPSSWGWGQQTACMASLTSTDPSEEAFGSLDANPCDRHLIPWTESDGSAGREGWPVGFLQPGSMLRHITEPWAISNFQFEITSCLWWTCSSIQAVYAAQIFSTGFVSSLGSGSRCLLCGHLCFRSALDQMKLEQKYLPSQNTLQGAKAPEREARGSVSPRRTSKKYLHCVILQSLGGIPESVAELIQVIVFHWNWKRCYKIFSSHHSKFWISFKALKSAFVHHLKVQRGDQEACSSQLLPGYVTKDRLKMCQCY